VQTRVLRKNIFWARRFRKQSSVRWLGVVFDGNQGKARRGSTARQELVMRNARRVRPSRRDEIRPSGTGLSRRICRHRSSFSGARAGGLRLKLTKEKQGIWEASRRKKKAALKLGRWMYRVLLR